MVSWLSGLVDTQTAELGYVVHSFILRHPWISRAWKLILTAASSVSRGLGPGVGPQSAEEGLGGLGERPCPSGFKFEDGHSLGRPVVWSTVRVDLGHASVFDAEFLTEQLDLLVE